MNMSAGASLAPYFARLETCSALRWQGRVTQVIGPLVESEGPFCSVGEICHIHDAHGRVLPGEIVGFRGSTVLSMPLDLPRGVRHGDRLVTWGERATLRVSEEMLGRVLDGRGQRVGIFGGSGVGKSTLIGMMARNTGADLTVLGLVGERGREVRDFLENSLGDEGRKRAVVVVSTSDQSPLLRIRAALSATAVAEYFSAQGKNVLLVVDSLTRLAMAQREIGLAAGEPPTAKGYTPSCFAMLARLIERAGKFGAGSITAFYTVLMEGDDEQDPLVDGVRALLDGHVMLDRRLAVRSHYPPIAILDSVSRLMPAVSTAPHLQKAHELRRLLAAYTASEDLIRIGAYQKGRDPTLDKALAMIPDLNRFLMQRPGASVSFSDSIAKLLALPS